MDATAINQRAWNRPTRHPGKFVAYRDRAAFGDLSSRVAVDCTLHMVGCQPHALVFAFGIIVAPILSRLLSDAWDNYDPQQDRPLPNAVMMLASLLICFFAFPGKQNLINQVAENSPVKAVEFIQNNQPIRKHAERLCLRRLF